MPEHFEEILYLNELCRIENAVYGDMCLIQFFDSYEKSAIHIDRLKHPTLENNMWFIEVDGIKRRVKDIKRITKLYS